MSRNHRVNLKILVGATLVVIGVLCCHFMSSDKNDALVAAVSPAPPAGGSPVAAAPSDVDRDWWTTAQKRIAASEYEFSAVEDALGAPNRAQNLRVLVSGAGVGLSPRAGDGGDWSWAWRTTLWGREDGRRDAAAGSASNDAARVELFRDGFSEWYENTPDGVEQGFTIAAAPAGSGRLLVEGRIAGGLTGRADGAGIDFLTGAGAAVLRYDHLLAFDAEGRELPAEMVLNGDAIRLLVDDADAAYPVVIDPLMTTPAWDWSRDHNYGQIGYAVATAGDVNGDGYSDVIVGAPWYSYYESWDGRAFCFLGGPDGLAEDFQWDQTTALDYGKFGHDVACAGDVNGDGYDDVIVGAPWHPLDGTGMGKVYIFPGSPTGLLDTTFWTLTAQGDGETHLGYSVSGAGDVNGDGYDDVIIGEPDWTDGGGDECGRVRIFTGAADTMHSFWGAWTGIDGDNFGFAVAGAGDINGDGCDDVICSRVDAVVNPGNSDRVYAYYGGAGGMTGGWYENGPQAGAEFGYALAGAGDVNGDGYADILIGAPWMYDGEDYNEGWAYCYLGSASGLESSPHWTYDVNQSHARLGYSVSTAGDVNGDGYADIMVSAILYDNGDEDEGRVWIFRGSANGLVDGYSWGRDGNQADAEYGHSVATAGDVNGDGFSDVIVGARYMDYDEGVDNGAVYVYHGGGYPCNLDPGWYAEGGQTSAFFGMSMAGVGDVNGDGYGDVLVGAPGYDNGQVDEGAVFLFLGAWNGLNYAPAWWAESNQTDSNFGYSVARAGDVDGNGLEDILVGAPDYSSTGSEHEGAAFLWYSEIGGGPSGTPANAHWAWICDQAGANAGVAVAGGDVNGDGYSDVFVGANMYDNGTLNEGAVFGFHGSATGIPAANDWFHDTGKANCSYGATVAFAGDMNGDGFGDLAVGAPYYASPADNQGLIFVYIGSESGLQTGAPWWYADSDQEGARLGASLACAGDVNGDGYSDIIAGAPYYDFTLTDQGAVFVWHGAAAAPPTGSPGNADYDATWPEDYAHMGYAVSSAGDFDGDGYGDVVIAAPHVNSTDYDVGAVFMIRGGESGLGYSVWMKAGDQEYGSVGSRLAYAGDVNGDGFGDVIVGAYGYDNGQSDEGVAWLYYGNGGRGLPRRPMQWDADFVDRVAATGLSGEDGVGLSLIAYNAGGRASVRLECEVKPADQPFDGQGTVFSDWHDIAAPTAAGAYVLINQAVGGLLEDTAYHWRARAVSDNPQFPTTAWFSVPYHMMPNVDFRTGSGGVGVEETPAAGAFALTNHPNPFNPTTKLSFTLPAEGRARLDIYDVRGRLVNTLIDGDLPAGRQSFTWSGVDGDGRPLSSGVYFARLNSGGFAQSRKLMLVK